MTMQKYDVVSSWIETSRYPILATAAAVISAVGLISLLAQVAIPLPWTPVPVTGQTMGVAFVSLLWGQRWGLLGVIAYLVIGGLGAPIFANAATGLTWGPTLGYLLGMVGASYVMSFLSAKIERPSFGGLLLITYAGSLVTFICGLTVLSFFIPSESLLFAGLLPFLPGDLIKNLIVAGILSHRNVR